MTKVKPAELCSSKKKIEIEVESVGTYQKRPHFFPWIRAIFMFVGGFGRVLKFVDDFMAWWNSHL